MAWKEQRDYDRPNRPHKQAQGCHIWPKAYSASSSQCPLKCLQVPEERSNSRRDRRIQKERLRSNHVWNHCDRRRHRNKRGWDRQDFQAVLVLIENSVPKPEPARTWNRFIHMLEDLQLTWWTHPGRIKLQRRLPVQDPDDCTINAQSKESKWRITHWTERR